MPHFRKIKQYLRDYLNKEDFPDKLPSHIENLNIKEWVSPLFACLPEGEILSKRAAKMLGYAVATIYSQEKEKARIIIRRIIWQMNEESGNIGWGLPYAFAQCLCHSKELAEEYHRILISYLREREGDSNYCDFAPLRIQCFDALELLLDLYPKYRELALIPLQQGMKDEDKICRKKAETLMQKYKLESE